MPTETSPPYTDFDLMPIAGKWRHGSSNELLSDTNPYSGELLTESPRVTVGDVDAAYVGARDTQPGWSQTTPGERSAVFLRAAGIIDRHWEELVDWLIREAGATRVRALVELGIVRATTMAAATHTAASPAGRTGSTCKTTSANR